MNIRQKLAKMTEAHEGVDNSSAPRKRSAATPTVGLSFWVLAGGISERNQRQDRGTSSLAGELSAGEWMGSSVPPRVESSTGMGAGSMRIDTAPGHRWEPTLLAAHCRPRRVILCFVVDVLADVWFFPALLLFSDLAKLSSSSD